MDAFVKLEEKINKALEIITRLKSEKESLIEANRSLETRVQHLAEQNVAMHNENENYKRQLSEASSMSNEVEEQMRSKLNDYIGKIDDILGTDI